MADFKSRAWARSQINQGTSEFILFTPIIPGRVPGERRTYEERLRFAFGQIGRRARRDAPNALTTIPTIHFARWAIIRPEDYLRLPRPERVSCGDPFPAGPDGHPLDLSNDENPYADRDDYLSDYRSNDRPTCKPSDKFGLRSWLLTVVVFDGDAKVYGREIAESIEKDLDRIFGNCEEYPGAADAEKIWAWFRGYQLETAVFHASTPGVSVVRIRQLEDFKSCFDAFLENAFTPSGEPVDDLGERLKAFARYNLQYASGFPAAGGSYKSKARTSEDR